MRTAQRRAGGARRAALGQSFDVVLTDIEMPEMNGFEFAENIRSTTI